MKIPQPRPPLKPEVKVAIVLLIVAIFFIVKMWLRQDETITFHTRFPEAPTNTTWRYDLHSRTATSAIIVKPLDAEGRWFLLTNIIAK